MIDYSLRALSTNSDGTYSWDEIGLQTMIWPNTKRNDAYTAAREANGLLARAESMPQPQEADDFHSALKAMAGAGY